MLTSGTCDGRVGFVRNDNGEFVRERWTSADLGGIVGHDMKGHARNIMTHHATVVTDDTSLGSIASILVHARIGGVPVVDAQERLVGFVSETDLMGSLLRSTDAAGSARDVMSTPAISVDEFATSDEVMSIFRERDIHHLPVVRSGKLVGIITPLDVLKFFLDRVFPPPPEAG